MTASHNAPNAFNSSRAVYTLAAATPEHPNLRCTLRVSPRFTAKIPAGADLIPAGAAYAACVIIRNFQPLQDWLVPISYGLRVAKGKGRRVQTRWLQLCGLEFNLGLEKVHVKLSIDAEGVTVDAVEVVPYWSDATRPVDAFRLSVGNSRLVVLR